MGLQATSVQLIGSGFVEEFRHQSRHAARCQLTMTFTVQNYMPVVSQTLRRKFRIPRRSDGIRFAG
jgi:hypothetical protein